MSLAKIIWLVSALGAALLAFVDTNYNGMILAVLGLASGWFLDADHRRGVIIAAIFLMLGGSGALNGLHGVFGDILGSLGKVFGAAAVMAILRTLIERIFLSNAASAT